MSVQTATTRPRASATDTAAAERRGNPRYPLGPGLAAEIVHDSLPAKGRIRDLSRGGCFVEADRALPPGVDLTIVLASGEDRIEAQARVVRLVGGTGLALEFTAMDGQHFRMLEHWIAMYLSAAWTREARKKANRVLMQIDVRVSGYDTGAKRFTERTHTTEINGLGGTIILRNAVRRGQRLVLTNMQSKVSAECMVVHSQSQPNGWEIGLAFLSPDEAFWPVNFPRVGFTSGAHNLRKTA